MGLSKIRSSFIMSLDTQVEACQYGSNCSDSDGQVKSGDMKFEQVPVNW